MTLSAEDELIIEQIWGDQDPEMSERELKLLILGIKIMAEEMAKKESQGYTIDYRPPTSLH